MARTFQMGAKMTLKDMFTKSISNASKATLGFKKSVDTANKSTGTFTDRLGRLHDSQDRYVAAGDKANVRTRTWINTNGKLSSSFGIVAKGIKAAVTSFGLMKAKNWLVDANADMETYKNTLTVVLKDEKKAVETLAWAEKFAAQTPFEIPQIVEATTRMSAYGINAEKTLGIVGDMASVMGKDLMQAVEAVADAQTGELERLKEFGITKKMIEDQAKAMKITVTNNKGQITDQKAFNAVLFKLMEDRYKGGMEMQSKTLKGMISNFQDFVSATGRELGKPIFDKVKEGLGNLLAWLQKLKDDGTFTLIINRVTKVGSVIFGVFGKVASFVGGVIRGIVDKVAAWYSSNKPLIDKVGVAFQTAFEKLAAFAGPIITWLKDTAIPGLVDVLGKVGTWVLKVAGWFSDNWGTIGPIILGIAAAWATYFAITKAIQIATKIWTAVQWALNAAMTANPIGLIITAIGVLIGIIILVVKNWDTVKAALIAGARAVANFFVGVWNKIKSVAVGIWDGIVGAVTGAWEFIKGIGLGIADFFAGIWNGIGNVVSTVVGWITDAWNGFKQFFSNLWDGIMEVVKAPINFLLSAVNTIIRGLNTISIDIPDWVPLVGGKTFGFNIPEIPYLAKGTNNWQGGPAYMNERGGELALLPDGSKVIPSDKTDKILDKPSGPSVHIDKLVDKIEIHQQPGEDGEALANRVITLLYEKLSTAAEIMNNDEMGVLVNG